MREMPAQLGEEGFSYAYYYYLRSYSFSRLTSLVIFGRTCPAFPRISTLVTSSYGVSERLTMARNAPFYAG